MKGLFLALLLGSGLAAWDNDAQKTRCVSGEFEIDGYYTGQNIDMDYAATGISLRTDQDTQLTVAFIVPRLYVEQYEAAAFAISFNRKHVVGYDEMKAGTAVHDGRGEMQATDSPSYTGDDAWKNDVSIIVPTEAATANYACFTNRYQNDTRSSCDIDAIRDDVWGVGSAVGDARFTANAENDCLVNMQAVVPWVEVMKGQKPDDEDGNPTNSPAEGGGAFGEVEVRDNGDFTEVFLTATVETWSHFTETTGADYEGQMTGKEDFNGDPGTSDTDRTGKYSGDGGADGTQDANPGLQNGMFTFPALHMDDERYTLYQIPFILRFPKTVVVETTFQVGSRIRTLTAVVAQDVIQVNFNPDEANTDETFAVLDVTFTTEVQYPYAIHGPKADTNGDDESTDKDARMTVVRGNDRTADDVTQSEAPRFIKWDDPGSCGSLVNSEMCRQNFKIRIAPGSDNPCTVAGDYTVEFWANCQTGELDNDVRNGPHGCSLEDENFYETVAERRDGNGYFTFTFTVAHQDFCPQVMDEVKVVADLSAYHDETFADAMKINENNADVFSNDELYYEAKYRTASNMAVGDNAFNNNDFATDAYGTDQFIDFVRATRIFIVTTIGRTEQNAADAGWTDDDESFTKDTANYEEWMDTVSWSLGGTRLAGRDFTSDALTVLDTPAVGAQTGDRIRYHIILCEVDEIDPAEVQWTDDSATDCFTAKSDLATQYFDFNKVNVGRDTDGDGTIDFGGNTADQTDCKRYDAIDGEKIPGGTAGTEVGTANCIDENEVAFKMRLDERIIPIGPRTDNSYVTIQVEAEVYYKGHRHPTRRLLQANPPTNAARNQKSVQSLTHNIRYKPKKEIKTCIADPTLSKASMEFVFDFGNSKLPATKDEVNNWAVNFGYQIGKAFEIVGAVKVVHMETASEVLMRQAGHDEQRRRLDDDSKLHVTVDIGSTKFQKAGKIANLLQAEFTTGETLKTKLDVLRKHILVDMNVPECSLENPSYTQDTKVLSSAASFSTLLAFVIAAITLIA